MSYTEHLNLKVIDDTDAMTNVFTQGNALATQLEALFGSNYSDYQNLSTITADIEGLETDVSALDARATALESADNTINARITAVNNELGTRITKLENGKGYYIDDNGNRVDGIINRYEVNMTAVGSTEEATIDVDNTHRFLIKNARGFVYVNLNTLLGITSMTGKKILNAVCYQTEYSIARQIESKFSFSGVYQPPTQNYYQLAFTAADLKITSQTNSGSATWSPQDPRSYQDLEVTVIFDLFEEIQE
jgi:hypothetical protein